MRRNPLNWERDVWDDFLFTFDGIVLDDSVGDRLIWTPMAAGQYTCRSLKKCQSPVVLIWKVMWKVPTPLKIKIFISLLIKQRLSIKERLFRLHTVSAVENICPLCGASGESFSHPFILCDQMSSLWYRVARFWEILMVLPYDLSALFDWWMYVDHSGQRTMPWRLTFYALVWTIWTLHNCVIFRHAIFDRFAFLELIRFHFS